MAFSSELSRVQDQGIEVELVSLMAAISEHRQSKPWIRRTSLDESSLAVVVSGAVIPLRGLLLVVCP